MEYGDFRPKADFIITLLKEISRNTDSNACCTSSTSAGLNSSIPAGFASISIVLLSGSINIAMTDGSTYSMSTVGEVLVQAATQNSSLPAYAITGVGTWKWIGIK